MGVSSLKVPWAGDVRIGQGITKDCGLLRNARPWDQSACWCSQRLFQVEIVLRGPQLFSTSGYWQSWLRGLTVFYDGVSQLSHRKSCGPKGIPSGKDRPPSWGVGGRREAGEEPPTLQLVWACAGVFVWE